MAKQKFKRKVLDNGLTILFEKRDLPIVSIGYGVKYGAMNESAEEKGIAHFIEHMLYKGTPTRDALKIAKDIEKNGGELNGFTNNELTGYLCEMPAKYAFKGLEALTDMVKNPLFDKKELEKERKVIFEEIKMGEDDPMTHIGSKIGSLLYEGAFGLPIIGTEETLNSLSREKLVEKFNLVYTPSNMILAVVGDANFDEICDYTTKQFCQRQGQVPEPNICQINKTEIEEKEGIKQANLILAYHSVNLSSEKRYTNAALMMLMGGGMSSRLFNEIREKRNLSYGIGGGTNGGKFFGYNYVYAGTGPENIELIKSLILKEFGKACKDISKEELKDTKRQLIGNFQISQERSIQQMNKLLYAEKRGTIKDFYNTEKKISDVTLEDVREMAKINDYSFFALIPQAK